MSLVEILGEIYTGIGLVVGVGEVPIKYLAIPEGHQ